MKTIVLPIDFSERSEYLIDEAVKFAKEVNAKISLIHVAPLDIGFAIGDMGFQYFPEIEKSEIKEELLQLNRLEQRIIAQDIDCDHLLKQGEASSIILEFAEEKCRLHCNRFSRTKRYVRCIYWQPNKVHY